MKLTGLLTLLSLLASGDAFWRLECHGRVGLARMDPLMAPGSPSQHAHAIHGSSGFHESATYDDLMNGNCTSCAVEQDKSAYWHPAVYFEDAETGTFEVVPQVGGMIAYYLLFKNDNEKIKAFPKGFRMIAGDSTRRNYSEALGDVSQPDPEKSSWKALGQTDQDDLQQRAVGFNCLNYLAPPEGTLFRHFMPKKDFLDSNCANGLRFELMFPSCWNGKDLDAPNHRDHMAYPDLVMNGNCPSSHPQRLPSMLYEVIWNTSVFKNRNGRFVVANGDIQGFGYHGDFMMGWDEDFLQQAVDTCTNISGRMQDCPLFKIQTEDQEKSCQMNTVRALVAEDAAGPGLDGLPGNVAIQLGPEPATLKSPPPATTSVEVPDATYSPGSTATGSTYLPGQVFHGKSDTVSGSGVEETPGPVAQDVPSSPPPAETTPPPPAPLAPSSSEEEDGTFSAVSTQYITVGNVVSKIVWAEEIVYITQYEDSTSTTTVSGTTTIVPNARARRHLRHLHEHARHH